MFLGIRSLLTSTNDFKNFRSFVKCTGLIYKNFQDYFFFLMKIEIKGRSRSVYRDRYHCSKQFIRRFIFSLSKIYFNNLISGSNSSTMETHLCVVGKENAENKDLMESIEVNK